MRRSKKLIALFALIVMVFSFTISVNALNTYKGDFHVEGGASRGSSSVSGWMRVTNPYGLSGTLSCNTYGYGYNGANAIVGAYSASVSKDNVQSVNCSGSGVCYTAPAYGRAWYTFQERHGQRHFKRTSEF